MKQHVWKTYAFWILFSEAVGFLSGWLSREGTQIYNATIAKPSFAPPGILFPIVWTILYALMGIGAARIYLSPSSRDRSRSLLLFVVQLFFNFFWSIIFFNLQAFALAFIWLLFLWILIVLMIRSFARTDRIAAYLQIPYLIWVTFALYLNFMVWILNR